MKYSDKLKDPRWQKKRLEILERDNWQCQSCGDKTSTLHIHHLIYIYNQNPWDYHNSDLLTLCDNCHEYEGESRKEYESQLLNILRVKRFLADDISCVADIIYSLSELYHPGHISEALRWGLCSIKGSKSGRKSIGQIVAAFEKSKG